jgi:hypothetical protein
MSSNERTFTVHLRNDGNVGHDYHVVGYDPTGDLDFDGDSGPLFLQPGEEEDVALTVRAARRPLLGVPAFYPFETQVRRGDGSVVHQSTSHLRVTPLIPLWLPLLLPLLLACGALLLIIRFPPGEPTATATATGTTTITVTATGTATRTPTSTMTTTVTPTPTATGTATPTGTPTTTLTPTPTPSPTASPTGTLTPTVTAIRPEVTRTFAPLTFSVSVRWRFDPASDLHAIADVVVSAQGGDGSYTYYRDDILQPGPTFSYFWRRCANNPVSFRVDSGDGQSVRVERAEFSACSP